MVNYQNGKIYKIMSDETDLVYVGSTTQDLCVRMASHRRDYKAWLNNDKKYVSSFEILKFDNYRIVLIENYPCNDRTELNKKEQEYIEKLNCVNKRNSFLSEIKKKNILKNIKISIKKKYLN